MVVHLHRAQFLVDNISNLHQLNNNNNNSSLTHYYPHTCTHMCMYTHVHVHTHMYTHVHTLGTWGQNGKGFIWRGTGQNETTLVWCPLNAVHCGESKGEESRGGVKGRSQGEWPHVHAHLKTYVHKTRKSCSIRFHSPSKWSPMHMYNHVISDWGGRGTCDSPSYRMNKKRECFQTWDGPMPPATQHPHVYITNRDMLYSPPHTPPHTLTLAMLSSSSVCCWRSQISWQCDLRSRLPAVCHSNPFVHHAAEEQRNHTVKTLYTLLLPHLNHNWLSLEHCVAY